MQNRSGTGANILVLTGYLIDLSEMKFYFQCRSTCKICVDTICITKHGCQVRRIVLGFLYGMEGLHFESESFKSIFFFICIFMRMGNYYVK